mmetsp:Transcript_14537/g.41418  ORF Transcript_14537/g.41418 Transcript_14537/m.41418 type:complete len:224 (+) Transcript_14537:288-959(+)
MAVKGSRVGTPRFATGTSSEALLLLRPSSSLALSVASTYAPPRYSANPRNGIPSKGSPSDDVLDPRILILASVGFMWHAILAPKSNTTSSFNTTPSPGLVSRGRGGDGGCARDGDARELKPRTPLLLTANANAPPPPPPLPPSSIFIFILIILTLFVVVVLFGGQILRVRGLRKGNETLCRMVRVSLSSARVLLVVFPSETQPSPHSRTDRSPVGSPRDKKRS